MKRYLLVMALVAGFNSISLAGFTASRDEKIPWRLTEVSASQSENAKISARVILDQEARSSFQGLAEIRLQRMKTGSGHGIPY